MNTSVEDDTIDISPDFDVTLTGVGTERLANEVADPCLNVDAVTADWRGFVVLTAPDPECSTAVEASEIGTLAGSCWYQVGWLAASALSLYIFYINPIGRLVTLGRALAGASTVQGTLNVANSCFDVRGIWESRGTEVDSCSVYSRTSPRIYASCYGLPIV